MAGFFEISPFFYHFFIISQTKFYDFLVCYFIK